MHSLFVSSTDTCVDFFHISVTFLCHSDTSLLLYLDLLGFFLLFVDFLLERVHIIVKLTSKKQKKGVRFLAGYFRLEFLPWQRVSPGSIAMSWHTSGSSATASSHTSLCQLPGDLLVGSWHWGPRCKEPRTHTFVATVVEVYRTLDTGHPCKLSCLSGNRIFFEAWRSASLLHRLLFTTPVTSKGFLYSFVSWC